MGAITGLLGLGGGAGGTSVPGPQQADLTNPLASGSAAPVAWDPNKGFFANAEATQAAQGDAGNPQISAAYAGNQAALGQQQNLLSALQNQNGIQNQSSVYNQLQGVANGTGPNPAQAMLNQATGQNVANQASMAAGQRGAAGNVGLLARQAGQQGSAAQQQAAGQGATMQANQSLGALGQLSGLATQQVGQQMGATGAVTGAQQGEQGQLLNALGQYNQAQVGSQSSVNAGNAALAGKQMEGQQSALGGLGGGIAAGLSLLANGGDVSFGAPQIAAPNAALAGATAGVNASGPQSFLGRFLNKVAPPSNSGEQQNTAQTPSQQLNQGMGQMGEAIGEGISSLFAQGGQTRDFRAGGPVKAAVKAEKAVANGNDYANDKIPAVLSEHEIVIPRSVTMGKDPVRGAAEFVAKTLAKKKRTK